MVVNRVRCKIIDAFLIYHRFTRNGFVLTPLSCELLVPEAYTERGSQES